jgi:hypothetical protein
MLSKNCAVVCRIDWLRGADRGLLRVTVRSLLVALIVNGRGAGRRAVEVAEAQLRERRNDGEDVGRATAKGTAASTTDDGPGALARGQSARAAWGCGLRRSVSERSKGRSRLTTGARARG